MSFHTFAYSHEDSGRATQISGGGRSKAPVASLGPEDIRRILKARRARSKFFDGDLFADPAWDMLLELYAAEVGGQRISVSSLCTASDVPATTALRWIHTLEREQLVKRVGDPLDGRRFFVSLTGKGSNAMGEYFRAIPVSRTL